MEKNLIESKNKSDDLDSLILIYIDCKDDKKKRMLHLHIVETGMRIVKKIAGNISAQSGIPNEDLVQVGSIGLIKAIEFFNQEEIEFVQSIGRQIILYKQSDDAIDPIKFPKK